MGRARYVEGANYYEIEVSRDPGFGGTSAIPITTTRQTSFTPITTLPNGVYYWRVRIRRYDPGKVINNWSEVQSFTLTLPGPTGLTPVPPIVVGKAPTLCWTPLILNSNPDDPFPSTPFFAAWKYHVEVSTDPTFSSTYDSVDTEQACWTSTKGYDDANAYYWRVAAKDGDNRMGNYSATQTFTKQYPVSTLVSPLTGVTIEATPTFIWTVVNGAARYRLEVSLFANFSTLYDSTTTDNIRYTPTKKYAINKTYYWRVAIIDDDGNYGPFKSDRSHVVL